MMKKILFILLIFLAVMPFIVTASPTTFTQGMCNQIISEPGTYTLTEDILDCVGSYAVDIRSEDVVFDCADYTIELDVGTANPAIVISAKLNNVIIHNCNVRGDGATVGINVRSNALVENNNLFFNHAGVGIRVEHGSNSIVRDNYVDVNDAVQLMGISSSKYNLVENNHLVNGGITVGRNSLCTIRDNLIEGSGTNDIYLNGEVSCCNVYNNDITTSETALHISNSENNYIYNNAFTSTATYGTNTLALQDISVTNYIYGNTFTSNHNVMFYFNNAENVKIYNNLFKSPGQPKFNSNPSLNILENDWSDLPQYGARIYSDGDIIGGNYWTNFDGTGFSDTCVDADLDGFCDVKFSLNADNEDDYPLSTHFNDSLYCGMAIFEDTVLNEDITGCTPAYGLPIIAIIGDDIELDCDGHQIEGTLTDSSRAAIEVYSDRFCDDNHAEDITVRNCNVEVDNALGIYFSQITNGLLENNDIDSEETPITATNLEFVQILSNDGYCSNEDDCTFMQVSGSDIIIDDNTFDPYPDLNDPGLVDRHQKGIVLGDADNHRVIISNNVLPTNSYAIKIGEYTYDYEVLDNVLGTDADYYTEYCFETAGSDGLIEDNWMYADYGTFELESRHQRLDEWNVWLSGGNNTIRNNEIYGEDPVKFIGNSNAVYTTAYYPFNTLFYNNLIVQTAEESSLNSDDENVLIYPGKLYDSITDTNLAYLLHESEFNVPQQVGDRVYSLGNEIGGNYWTDIYGTGYSDTCADVNLDGFCDVPLEFDDENDSMDNIDYLPLSDEYDKCYVLEKPGLILTFPEGGETLSGKQIITWDISSLSCNNSNHLVDLIVYKGGSMYLPDGKFATVPLIDLSYELDTTDLMDGSGYQIIIQLTDNILINDISTMFEIHNAPSSPFTPASSGSYDAGNENEGGSGSGSFDLNALVLTSEYQELNNVPQKIGKSFSVDELLYTATLDNVENDTAKINISGESVTVLLSVGEEKIVDIDYKLAYLVQIKLNSITNGRIDFSMRQIPKDAGETEYSVTAVDETKLNEAEIELGDGDGINSITGAVIGPANWIAENRLISISLLFFIAFIILLLIKTREKSPSEI